MASRRNNNPGNVNTSRVQGQGARLVSGSASGLDEADDRNTVQNAPSGYGENLQGIGAKLVRVREELRGLSEEKIQLQKSLKTERQEKAELVERLKQYTAREKRTGEGLAKKIHLPQVGFKAQAPASLGLKVTKHKRLTCFTDVISYHGGHYNRNDHMFTVPITGPYEITLEHSQSENTKGYIWLDVKKESRNPESGRWETDGLVFSMTDFFGDGTARLRDRCVSVEHLCRGDKLWVEVADERCKPKLVSPCLFSCVLKT